MSGRILVVEDESEMADALSCALEQAGYEVDSVDDGGDAIAAARTGAYDLMILELLLPGLPGLEVCRTLRSETDLPIVMLTAPDEARERVAGLETGADDCVMKPVSLAELVSRVRALLRRRELDRGGVGVQHVGGLELDRGRHAASVEGRPVQLTRSEFRLLTLLAAEPGRVFTREELLDGLWGSAFEGDRRAIDVHVSNVRRKLEPDPRNPQRLVTVRGVGYKLLEA